MIREYLPWVLSVITIWMTFLAGNKSQMAWSVGLVNQVLWLVWIVSDEAWGMIPMNVVLFVIYGRNYLKWRA